MADFTVGEVLTAAKLNTLIPAGTRMLFDQDSAPNGWTRDTTINDRVTRIVSGARAPNAGTWTISGITLGAGASITVDLLPAVESFVVKDAGLIRSLGTGASPVNRLADSVASDGTWRPLVRDVILCSRN